MFGLPANNREDGRQPGDKVTKQPSDSPRRENEEKYMVDFFVLFFS